MFNRIFNQIYHSKLVNHIKSLRLSNFFFYFKFTKSLIRAHLYKLIGQPSFRKIGVNSKIYGGNNFKLGKNISLGDFCWIEAIETYKEISFKPILEIGDDVAISDLTHISTVHRITIGSGCLLGSKIYIGDHSHGDPSNLIEILNTPPSKRPLSGIDEIIIGENCWIGDGAVILAGSHIHSNSIIGANSVVKLNTNRPALIAGIPAKVVKYYN